MPSTGLIPDCVNRCSSPSVRSTANATTSRRKAISWSSASSRRRAGGQLVKWGLIPSWAKEPSIGNKLNNARGETVAEKPAFLSSFPKHRCLIPANGFYEWAAITEDGKIRKQPYYIRPAEPNCLFAFAGLLAAWKAPAGDTLVTTCIITTGRIQ